MIARLMFFASLCVLVSVGTAAAMRLQIFPFTLLNRAFEAAEAFWDVYTADQINFLRVDEDGPASPWVSFAPGYEDDGGYILAVGGPGTLVSHCPDFGCLAWVMNRRGDVLHSWEVDAARLWAKSPHDGVKDHNKIAASGLHLFENGDLLASFGSRSLFPYGVGMAKFDKNGALLWQKANFAHHWFSVAPDGSIYTPAHELVESPLALGESPNALGCSKGQIYSDVVLKVGATGETLEVIRIIELLSEAGLVGLLTDNRQQCDPVHLNDVEYVTEELANGVAGLEAGDLILSLRQLDAIMVLDAQSRDLKWRSVGRTIDQHSPNLVPGGRIIVFDNFGGRKESGGSRLVALTYGTDLLEEIYPGSDSPAETVSITAFTGTPPR